MAILQDLPLSLCKAGPKEVDGVGNFYLEVLAPAPSQLLVSTLFFLDSHGQRSSWTVKNDYEPIKQSQIDWFVIASRKQQRVRDNEAVSGLFYLPLAFQHIPLPEFGNHRLRIRSGSRGEPTESPNSNSHFYHVLSAEGILALGCGHDHVNDFCALLPDAMHQDGKISALTGPWLCYGGGSGFGGYCSYGKKRFHRRMRVWEFDMDVGSVETWKRVESAMHRVDKLTLVKNGVAMDTADENINGATWRKTTVCTKAESL